MTMDSDPWELRALRWVTAAMVATAAVAVVGGLVLIYVAVTS